MFRILCFRFFISTEDPVVLLVPAQDEKTFRSASGGRCYIALPQWTNNKAKYANKKGTMP